MDGIEDLAMARIYAGLSERYRQARSGQADILLWVAAFTGAAVCVSAWSGERGGQADVFLGMGIMLLIIGVPWALIRWWQRRRLWQEMWQVDLWFQGRGLHIREDGTTVPMSTK